MSLDLHGEAFIALEKMLDEAAKQANPGKYMKVLFDDTEIVKAIEQASGSTKESTSNEPEKYCLGCGCKLKAGTKFCEKC